MRDPLFKGLNGSLDLLSKFWLKQNLFNKKDFDCNNNPIYPKLLC